MPPKRGVLFWLCRCDCGTVKYVGSQSLRTGGTKSCGCLTNGMPPRKKIKDLTGKTFGLLTVVEMAPRAKRLTQWICRCQCGKEVIVYGCNLTTGNSTSCGCIIFGPKPDRQRKLQGQRFGKLVALNILPVDPSAKNKRSKWMCRCDCGRLKAIGGDKLVDGLTISCGCAARQGALVAFRPAEVRAQSAVVCRRRGDKGDFANSDVTAEKIRELFFRQKGRCANCPKKITQESMHRDHIQPIARGGLHRMSNIQLLCIPCNQRKYSKDPIDFARQEGRLL